MSADQLPLLILFYIGTNVSPLGLSFSSVCAQQALILIFISFWGVFLLLHFVDYMLVVLSGKAAVCQTWQNPKEANEKQKEVNVHTYHIVFVCMRMCVCISAWVGACVHWRVDEHQSLYVVCKIMWD